MNTIISQLQLFQQTVERIRESYATEINFCPFSIIIINGARLKRHTDGHCSFYKEYITPKDGHYINTETCYVIFDPAKRISCHKHNVYYCITPQEVFEIVTYMLDHPHLFSTPINSSDVLSQNDNISLTNIFDVCYPSMQRINKSEQ